jgi:hypothetical protein
MTRGIPCPNPRCGYRFTAADAAGAAAVICPHCGTVTELPRNQSSPAVVSGAATRPTDSRIANRTGSLVWMLFVSTVLSSSALIAGALYRQRHMARPRPAAAQEPYRSAEFNYSFRIPGPPWQRDDATRDRLHVNSFAFRRPDPDAWVALAVRDYPKYVPGTADLHDEAVRHLRRQFPDLQYEDDPKGGELGGRPAARLVFQGSVGDVVMSGDCHIATHQGFAYWLFRWCPAREVEALKDELAAVRDRFAFLDQRPDWKPPRTTFTGTKVAYTLTSEGDRWSRAAYPPADFDLRADLALEARGAETAPAKRTMLLVLQLPAEDGGDAVDRAKAYLVERQKEIYPETKLEELPPADATATAGQVGTAPGRVLTLKMVNTKDRERFVVLGVVPRPGGPLVLWAECDFARRALWESEFRRLMASFRPPA